jgi:hypothetical protein
MSYFVESDGSCVTLRCVYSAILILVKSRQELVKQVKIHNVMPSGCDFYQLIEPAVQA